MRTTTHPVFKVLASALVVFAASGSAPLRAQDSLGDQPKSVRLRVREAAIDPKVETAFAVTVSVQQDGKAAETREIDGIPVAVLKNATSFVIEVKSERDGFLRVFYHNAKGELIQLLPNQFSKEGFIRAGTPLLIGGPGDDYELVVEPPLGAECLAVLVSTRPFSDEGQVSALLQEKAFIEVPAEEVADAGVAVTKSVALVPREALVGAAVLHTETVE